MNDDKRAVQFAPFASLRGYYDQIHMREKLKQPRRELSEDEAAALSAKLSGIKKGDMLKVVYYGGDCYLTAVGVCRRIDLIARILTILDTHISTDDIISIEPKDQ